MAMLLAVPATNADNSILPVNDSLPVIRIATGMQGGGYYDIGKQMEKLAPSFGIKVEARETQGSWESLICLRDGQADFALTQLNAFVKYSNYYLDTSIVIVRPLYTENLHIVLREPFKIRSCASLVGKRVFFGRPGSGTAITANLFMDIMGLSLAQFPFVDAREFDDIRLMFKEENLDVAFHVGTIGNKVVDDLMSSTRSSLFSLDRSTIRHLTEESQHEELGILGVEEIPAGTYRNQVSSITTIAVPVTLVTLPSTADEDVARLIQLTLKAISAVQSEGDQGDMSLISKQMSFRSDVLYDKKYYPASEYPSILTVLEFTSLIIALGLLLWLAKHWTSKYLRTPRYRTIFVSVIFLTACIAISFLIYASENPVNESFGSPYETIWSTLLYLTSRLAGRTPVTFWGRMLVFLLLIAGSLLASFITSLITSKMIFDKLERRMASNQKKHFVILNWNIRALEVVRQIHSPDLSGSKRHVVVVVTDDKDLKVKSLEERLSTRINDSDLRNVYFSPGDPTDECCLENVNVLDSRTVLIIADDKEEGAADDKSMRSFMSIISLFEKRRHENKSGKATAESSGLHIVIELMNLRNSYTVEKMAEMLPKTVTVDIIAQGQMRTLLLAQASIIKGLTGFYKDLLSFDDRNNELYLVEIKGLAGRKVSFPQLASRILSIDSANPVIPVGYQRTNGSGEVELITNPRKYLSQEDQQFDRISPFYWMTENDKLLVIAYSSVPDIDLDEIGMFERAVTVA